MDSPPGDSLSAEQKTLLSATTAKMHLCSLPPALASKRPLKGMCK